MTPKSNRETIIRIKAVAADIGTHKFNVNLHRWSNHHWERGSGGRHWSAQIQCEATSFEYVIAMAVIGMYIKTLRVLKRIVGCSVAYVKSGSLDVSRRETLADSTARN